MAEAAIQREAKTVKLLMIGGRAMRPPSTAPRDGTRFLGIPKHKMTPERMVWDDQMRCFLTEDFGCVDRLACWVEGDVDTFQSTSDS